MNPSSSARWRLPAEPALDHFCTSLVALASAALGLWAFEWALALGWGLRGPQWAEAAVDALATSVATSAATSALTASYPSWRVDIFFWCVMLGILMLAAAMRWALRHRTLARAWELSRMPLSEEASTTPGPWAWWPLDERGEPGPVRIGDLQVRLDFGPWLLLQAVDKGRPVHPLTGLFTPSDWMLVRPGRLGVHGADGHRLRSALYGA